MFKAKLLITLALIGCIHQYYDDADTDLAKAQMEPASCSVYSSRGDIKSASVDTHVIGAQERSCADSTSRRDPSTI